jgi:hypothetical protein
LYYLQGGKVFRSDQLNALALAQQFLLDKVKNLGVSLHVDNDLTTTAQLWPCLATIWYDRPLNNAGVERF